MRTQNTTEWKVSAKVMKRKITEKPEPIPRGTAHNIMEWVMWGDNGFYKNKSK